MVNENQCDNKSEDDNLTQLISDDLGENKKYRRNRFASTDCSGLQILSEIANSREKIISAVKRIERSKSLDSNIRSPTSKHDNNEITQQEVCSDLIKSTLEEDFESTKVGQTDDTTRQSVKIKKKLIKKKKIRIKRLKKKNKEVKIEEDVDSVEKVSNQVPSDDVESDADVKNVNILTSFKETFQKFKLKHLSRSIVDTKTTTITKKIPTLENWTTIMQEKRLVKKDPEMPVLTPIIPDEKLLNNNTKIDVESSFFLDASKEPCCGSTNEEYHTDENNVGENNNDIEDVHEDAVIDEYVSLKKKVKLKKKYKESIQDFREEVEKDESLSKKKKKKKKDKKEKKEKDRLLKDKTIKGKEKKFKEKKDRKKEKVKKPKKEKYSSTETFIKKSDDELTIPKPASSNDMPLTGFDSGSLPSCELTSDDLRDGLRVLLRLGGHFHTSRVTEISPPDIYGVVVDKERGNKPHILSREEVLQQAVRDVKPRGAFDLPVGARVCAYWSSQLSYLHPGRVSAPDTDDSYVVIQLDDGDSRDIHFSQVRCLPHEYPVVESEQSIMSASIGSRKRGSTGSENNAEISKPAKKLHSEASKYEKKHSSKANKHSKKHKEHKEKKRKQKTTGWSVSVTEISEDKSDGNHPSEGDHPPARESDHNEEDTIDEEDVTLSSDKRQGSNNNKSPIAAFLPPQHSLWRWADAGHRQNSKS